MPTIAHISDLHLQSGVPERQAQIEPILQKVNEMKPDLVVISGDVTDDGWQSFDELRWAKAFLDTKLKTPWYAVPGNHDVGNFVTLGDETQNADLMDYSKWWGEVHEDKHLDSWDLWVGNWKVIGLNSMIFGSHSDEELWQWRRRIKSHLESVWESYNLALFLHAPLFANRPNEPSKDETAYWLGPEAARQDCWNRLSQTNLKLVATGHVHQTRLTEVDGVKIAWAPPASGTWVHAPGLPNPPMPERTGFFLHTLHDDGRVETELVECAPMLKLYEHKP